MIPTEAQRVPEDATHTEAHHLHSSERPMDNRLAYSSVTPNNVINFIQSGLAQLTLASRKELRKTRTVHDLRIITRKLRELLDAFEGALEQDTAQPKRPTTPKLLKHFGRALSASRDQAVVKRIIRAEDQPRSVRKLRPKSNVAPKRRRLKKLQRQLMSRQLALKPSVSTKECARLWRLHVQRRANEVQEGPAPDTRAGMKRKFYHQRRKAVRRLRLSLDLFGDLDPTYAKWVPLCVQAQDAYGAYLDLCTALRACRGTRKGIEHLKEARREALQAALRADHSLRAALDQ